MLNKNSDRAIYLQISDSIKNKIDSKNLQAGDIIDSENKLASIYSVTRLTARRATDHLVKLGYVYRVRGRGTFVSERKKDAVEFSPQKLYSFTEEMLALNMAPKNIVVEFQIMKASDLISKKLGILEGDMVYYVKRVRCVDEEPLILVDSYLPVSILPELNISVLSGSKYDYVENYTKQKITESIQEFDVCIATEDESNHLKVEVGAPLLVITNQTYLEDGTLFEYSIAHYKKSKHKVMQKAKRD